MKAFTTTDYCQPSRHYMVDITERIARIRRMVDKGEYFTINRPRRYGKTTTLQALARFLEPDYIVLEIDFEMISESGFWTEGNFIQAFSRLVLDQHEFCGVEIDPDTIKTLDGYATVHPQNLMMDQMFRSLQRWIAKSGKPVVLLIDEVDSASNNQVFLDFLSQLRAMYLKRSKGVPTFHSVVLAGVTDIKNLKRKIRKDEDSKQNSPWNIAADFDIDMSLPESGIKGMLDEYEADHHTGMDTAAIARKIRSDTNGYPYLVSRICQCLDGKMVPDEFPSLREAWTLDGVEMAIKRIVSEDNPLFGSLTGKLSDYPELYIALKKVLFQGDPMNYEEDYPPHQQLLMYGFARKQDDALVIDNRIFEMRLYRYFISKSKYRDWMKGEAMEYKSQFTKDGILNVPLIMERFIKAQNQIRDMDDENARKKFIEDVGREIFLTYLSPILNGTGTYSVEDRNAKKGRMDVVVHYNGQRYIIELKIWHGERYNEEGEKQINRYLDAYDLKIGYMLSFNFNKTKEPIVKQVHFGDKLLYEGIV